MGYFITLVCLWSVLILTVMAAQLVVPSTDAQDIPSFAVNLYKSITNSSKPEDNIAVSPFSADAALSMTLAGAQGNTKSELGTVLGINPNSIGWAAQKFKSINTASGSSYTLKSANGLFLERTYSILPRFREIITRDFGANISALDFVNQGEQARLQINNFVETNTNNKIHDLFTPSSLGPDTRLVLVNAVYFKANWEKKFDASQTSSQPFTLLGGLKKSVKLMNLQADFSYAESAELGGAQVLEMRYEHGDTSMIIILPKSHNGLQSLEQNLTAASLGAALRQLNRQKVNVFVPKFKINAGYDLVDKLQAMGIRAAFSSQADFSGISQKRDLQISKVVQKVFVEVDEKGTEAAAATGIQMVEYSLVVDSSEPQVFRADHPFLYLIRHNGPSKAILFMGRVSDPTKQSLS